MLSRVADALFWMSRYLERAEQVARLIDVACQLEFDLSGVVGDEYDLHWEGLLRTIQQTPADVQKYAPGQHLREATIRWMTFEPKNPNSIVSCVAKARSNARGVRGNIANEVWKHLNTLYLSLRDPSFVTRFNDSRHECYEAVINGSLTFQGMCDAIMPHDEGWHFIQLGKYFERADITIRSIKTHYELLRDLTRAEDIPLANLHWAAVLRGCAAYQSYQRLYLGRVDMNRAIGILLINPQVPRSAQFCLAACLHAVKNMLGTGTVYGETRPERILGQTWSDLHYADSDVLIREGRLLPFLDELITRCHEATITIQEKSTPGR